MNELQQLRDEITQLQTALTIKNGAIEQLKARVAELEAQRAKPVAWAVSGEVGKVDALCATYTLKSSAITHAESYSSELGSPLVLTPLFTSPQQDPERQVPEGFRVMKPTSAIVRDGDKWEIYAPCGSGGVVSEHEVSNWVVKELLDALAAAPQAEKPINTTTCKAGLGGRCVQDFYEHFLAYSALPNTPLLRYAYFHGAGADCEQVSQQADAEVPDCPDGPEFKGYGDRSTAPQAEQFCDGHCTWLDHHPDCEIGKAEQPRGGS